jgi:hypothetical protein
MIPPAPGSAFPTAGPARIAQTCGPYGQKTGRTGQTGQRLENAQELDALCGQNLRSYPSELASETGRGRTLAARGVAREIGATPAQRQDGAPGS